MKPEEIQLLKELFSTVGSVSSQGFDAMVRYTFASGLTWIIVGGTALLLSLVSMVIGMFKDFRDSDVNAFLVIGGGFIAIIALATIGANLVDVIEPAGATVKELLRAATR